MFVRRGPGLVRAAAGTDGAVRHQDQEYARRDLEHQTDAEQHTPPPSYAPPPAYAAPGAAEPDSMAELERLAELKKQGISDEELEARKKELLGG
jgi:hypothetical protein